MATKTLIVLFGNAGSGKTTFSEMLANEIIDYQGTAMGPPIINFADPIKVVAEHFIGIPKQIAYGSQKDKSEWLRYGRTARQWFQWIGTEIGRNQIDENIWVDRTFELAKKKFEAVDFVIVGDGRMEKELSRTKKLAEEEGFSFVSVGIYRPSLGSGPPVHWMRKLPLSNFLVRLASIFGWTIPPLEHSSESEPRRLIAMAVAGKNVFSDYIVNDKGLDDFSRKANLLIKKIVSRS